MSVSVGQVAPDFTLVNQRGEPTTLADLRGRKVVLVFYPFAFSATCTQEMCDLRDRRGEFDDDTVLLGISVDTKHALRVFAAQEGLGFDLLSDFWPHGAVAQEYGVFLAEQRQVDARDVRDRPRGRRAMVGREHPGPGARPAGLPDGPGRAGLTTRSADLHGFHRISRSSRRSCEVVEILPGWVLGRWVRTLARGPVAQLVAQPAYTG